MHKIIIGIFVLILGQAFANTQAIEKTNSTIIKQNTTTQKIALLVGIEDYNGTKDDLKGVPKDLKKMKKLFQEEGFQVNVLENENSLSLLEQLTTYSKSLSSHDYFIFYYSGHGYQIEDISHDEADGKDEGIVLSDGNSNTEIIDDTLNFYFSKIEAKKLIIFDACHSGTASKSFNDKFQVKAIPSERITNSFPLIINSSKKILKSNSKYIVLSSSQDNETSLSSKSGSLFTKYFVEEFSEHKSESFSSLMNRVRKRLLFFCLKKNYIPKHPKIEASSEVLKGKSFGEYFITNYRL